MEMGSVIVVAVGVALVALVVRAQFQSTIVYEWDVGLCYRDGRFRETLAPGRHWRLRGFARIEVFTVRTSDQAGTSGLIDVSSADKLPFRISAWFVYKVINPREFHERLGFIELPRAVAAALTEVAATNRLEDLLAGRGETGERLLELAAPKLADCELTRVEIDTVQLPPETRRLFIEVEKARLEGLAALERARGEHAALRALANAARLLKDNPELTNLRLLQSVAGAPKGSTTIVLGQGSLAGYAPEPKPD
jgi:regulator of protease activity HflC (stomatin/prohibitin superfamily)